MPNTLPDTGRMKFFGKQFYTSPIPGMHFKMLLRSRSIELSTKEKNII